MIIGVDTGGTFTDLIFRDAAGWSVHKLLSTPANPAEAVLAGLQAISADTAGRNIVHGSTVATNAILERKGVKTALVTNKGFEDVLVIGRQNRSRLYDLTFRKEPPIVPDELRFGVSGRILSDGSEAEPFDPDQAREIVERIVRSGAESVAVCLLFAFADPAHELAMGRLLDATGLSLSLSHEILAEFREFERTSTTVVNAYVSPKMARYITFLLDHLDQSDALRIMQSNGGSISADTAMKESVRTILSGPAGGVVGARTIGLQAGFERLITFDMGGTSTDVSLLDHGLSLTLETSIADYPVKTPMLDIHTVGAGGGSIASIDCGGALLVGPESAGADPGPICYGKGDRITVTDANLFLGRLLPDQFLGRDMLLYSDRLETPFRDLASQLGLDPVELAEGILTIANANMERAIRVISVERGFDPREFCLFSFGGAGGLHAAFLARMLGIPRVLVPRNPGILSAIGMLMADVVKDYSQTIMRQAASLPPEELEAAFGPLEERGKQELLAEGIPAASIRLERALDMRYQGQSYELVTPLPDAAEAAAGDTIKDVVAEVVEIFHTQHEKQYGYRNASKPVEIVNVRLRARGMPEKPELDPLPAGDSAPPENALLCERPVIFDGQSRLSAVWQRDALLAGNEIQGPAIVVEYSSTIVLPPFARGRVDAWGNLVLTIEDNAA